MNVLGVFSMPDWLAVFLIIITAAYVYFTWHFDYWKNQNVKTGLYIPFLGSMWTNLFYVQRNHDLRIEIVTLQDEDKPYTKQTRRATKSLAKFGGHFLFRIYEMRNPALMVADLDLIKQIIIKDFHNFPDRRPIPIGGKSKITRLFLGAMEGGEEWKFHRSVLSPTFTSGKLRGMGNLMDDCGDQMIKNFHNCIKEDPNNVDLKKTFGLFAMDIIATCCFGFKINSENPQDPFIVHGRMLFDRSFVLLGLAIVLLPKLIIDKLGITFLPEKSLTYFENVVHKVVGMRKEENRIRNDFLQLLLDAQRENEEKHLSLNANCESNGDERQAKVNFAITEEAVVAHSMLFFIAGFDAVASTISFVVYALATNPDCQDKLIQEIDESLAKNGRLTHEVVMGMRYLDMVISETLRLFPPATRLERRCNKDCVLGGIQLKKGMMVAIPVSSIHYSEEYYPNPEKFDPERFTPENKAKRDPATYMPFGAGPRNCIGNRFALMETKIAVAKFFSEFRASPSSRTQIPLKFRLGMPFLLPKDGIHLKVEKRRS